MPPDGNISRRDLFRARFFGRAAASITKPLEDAIKAAAPTPATPTSGPAKVPPPLPSGRRATLPVHRPPGAVPEAEFLQRCTRCAKCIEVCPPHAITLAPARFREAAGTPMIDPHAAACIMCADTPCITACEPGVLKKDRPLKMGSAMIRPMDCLAHGGSLCTVCSERCPVPGAIELSQGKPRIVEAACTGCGVCLAVCPAPVNAVMVMPLPDRA